MAIKILLHFDYFVFLENKFKVFLMVGGGGAYLMLIDPDMKVPVGFEAQAGVVVFNSM